MSRAHMVNLLITIVLINIEGGACHKVFSAEGSVVPELYQVGVAKIDITPDYPIRLSGFGFRREESEGVLIPIYARALAIGSDNDGPSILMTVDSTGISDSIVTEVALQLASNGVSREKLAITATHTHTAPMVKGILPTLFGQPIPVEHQAHIDQYTKELTAHLVSVARAALKSRESAQLWWGTGEISFSKNRRSPKGGPVDHRLPTLAVKSPSGEVRAVLASYACHAVTLSHNKIGGDWPGFASESIERMHPGIIAMISIGCGADQNPIPGVVGDKVDVAQSQGLELATEVDRVLKNAMKPIQGKVTGQLERFELALAELPPRSYWEERAKKGRYIGHHAQVQLDVLDSGKSLPTSVDYSVQTWAFGNDLAFVFLPGEVVVDYAIRIGKEFDRSRMWVMAYANDTPCYIPSERVLEEGGYEGGSAMTYYNKPAKLAPGLEQKIIDATDRLVSDDFDNQKVAKANAGLPRLSPAESLNRLIIPSDWSAQVIAAEPLTSDPVAFDFAPDGSLWVCEMHDYPSGVNGNFEPGGKVRILRDDNDDGIYDRSTLFLDRLPFPTGVTTWRNGVLICAAPDIVYAEDTDGDDVADVRRVLFSGFGTENYQARVNSLTYGLDGWVYGACGLFGGNIKSHQTGETVALGNHDFRIDPDRGILEPLTGRSQQGRVRNDDGDWFGCSNGQPCWYYPLLQDDSRPGLKSPPFITSVPTGEVRKLYPEIADYQRFKLSGPAGQVTAACGLGIYRDDWLGHDLQGNAIVCEPVNLVLHRRVLRAEGLIFKGDRASGEEQAELITSTDNWFRPVQVRTGPDGGLWIADMSRGVIEHPRWIPEEFRKKLDIRAGDDQGRLIRILRKGHSGRPAPKLSELSSVELVEVLRSPNGTRRDLAQQLLLWSEDHSTVAAIQSLAVTEVAAPTRSAALWILARYGALSMDVLRANISSDDPQVRRQAVRVIAEHRDQIPHSVELLELLRDEKDLFVIRELVEALRHEDSPRTVAWLVQLYRRHHLDRHLKFIILRAVHTEDWAEFVAKVIDHEKQTPAIIEPLLSISLASRDIAALQSLLAVLLPENQPTIASHASMIEQVAVAAWRDKKNAERWLDAEVQSRLQTQINNAHDVFSDVNQSENLRLSSVGLLGLEADSLDEDLKLLAEHLGPQSSPALQLRIISCLDRTADQRVPELLLANWSALGPNSGQRILDLVLSRPDSAIQFLEKIHKNEIAANVLDATRRQLLLQHPNDKVRLQAEAVLENSQSESRNKIIDHFRKTLSLTGDPQRGTVVYEKRCSVCHKIGETGHAVGPDFSESRNKAWSALLTSLLNPNAAVDQRFAVYVVATNDGRVLQGLLAAEDGESITIKGQQEKLTVVQRSEIDVIKNTGRSMMPEGLEKEMTAQDFADLFALITTRHQSGETTSESAANIAIKLLDDSLSQEDRQTFLHDNFTAPADIIRALTANLPANDLNEEYRRIPWIWRVAIAAGKKDNSEDLESVLLISLPTVGGPLKDWQAVVIGGGVINGMSQNGVWPHERIAELIGNDRDFRNRWQHALAEASKMSDQKSTRSGTRYDALRMIAMNGWDQSGDQLVNYLTDARQSELQMGAVSGLLDVPDPPATETLISHLADLTPENLHLAIEGLVRSEDRALLLLKSTVDGKTSPKLFSEELQNLLRLNKSTKVQSLAVKVFGK